MKPSKPGVPSTMTHLTTIPAAVTLRCIALNKIISQAAITLLRSQEWQMDLCSVVQSLAIQTGVDRAFLIQQVGSQGMVYCQWASVDNASRPNPACGDNSSKLSCEYLASLSIQTSPTQNQSVAANPGETLETSMLAFPIGGEEPWGWMVFETCAGKRKWYPMELDTLRSAAEVIFASLERASQTGANISADIRLRDLFDQLPVVVYTAEIEDVPQITWVSPQVEMHIGWRPDELLAKPNNWMELIWPEDRVRVERSLKAAILTRSSLSVECRLVSNSGSPIWFRHDASILYDNTGKPHLIQGVLQNINQSKNIEAELNRLYHEEHLQRLMVEGLTVTSSALSATMDVNRIPDLLLQELAHILPYDTATFWNLDGDHLELCRARGYSLVFGKEVEGHIIKRMPLETTPTLKLILDTGKPLIIETVEPGNHPLPHGFAQHIRSWAGAPILVQGKPIGLFTIESRESGRFNQSMRSILSAICAQAGLSYQNANLYQAEKRLRTRAEMLQKATAALTAELELPQLLEQVMNYLGSVVQHDSVCIFLYEDENKAMRAVAGRGFKKPKEIIGKLYSADNSLFTIVFQQKKPLIIDDTLGDARFERWGEAQHIRGWMGIPLIWREKVIGCMTVDSRSPNAYDEDTANYALAFANQVASAIQISRLFSELQSLALSDPLTGAINRRQFFEMATAIVAKTKSENRTVSAIMIDVDNYKKINDTHGHLSGDLILKVVTDCFRSVLNPDDLLSRVGGDEFAVLLPDQGRLQAEEVAERLRASLEQAAIIVRNQQVDITASFGVAEIDRNRMDLDDLLNRADQALYLSKSAGKNKVS